MRAAIVGLLLLITSPLAAGSHPELEAARKALAEAESQLKSARSDYEGHRRLALHYVRLALEEIDRGKFRVEQQRRRREAGE